MKQLGMIVHLFFILASISSSQPVDQWFRFYGGAPIDYGLAIEPTPDGGFAVLCSSHSFNHPYREIVLMKIDVNGNRKWIRRFTDSDFSDGFQVLADGGFVIVAYTHDSSQVYRLDSYGNIVWTYEYENHDYQLLDVTQLPDGRIVTVAESEYFYADLIVMCFNDTGVLEWSSTLQQQGLEHVCDMQLRYDGGLVIFGTSINPNPDIHWAMLMMFVSDTGELETSLFYDNGDSDYARVGLALNDGYLLAGYLDGPFDGIVIRTDLNGNEVWQYQHYEGSYFNSATQTPDGGFAMVGHMNANELDARIVKLTPNGEQEWGQTYMQAGSENLTGVVAVEDTVLYTVGTAEPFGSDNGLECLLWVLGRPEPDPAPQVRLGPIDDYPIQIPAGGRYLQYYLDLKNGLNEAIDVRVHKSAYTPGGAYVDLNPEVPLTLPAQSQHTYGEFYQIVPSWAPPGRYAFIVQLLAVDSDSVIAEDSKVFRKFEE